MLGEKIKQLRDGGKDATEYEQELVQHKKKAVEAYEHLKNSEDKNIWDPSEWKVICMDLQQTFVIPKTSQGSHYYMSKVNVYNFCIFEQQTEKAYFYVWEEYNGKKRFSRNL